MEDRNSTTTKLLTLLNVSAVKSGKRKRVYGDSGPSIKLNKRKTVQVAEAVSITPPENTEDQEKPTHAVSDAEIDTATRNAEEGKDDESPSNPYQLHFGADNHFLTQKTREAVDCGKWEVRREKWDRLGTVVECLPEGSKTHSMQKEGIILEKLEIPYKKRQGKLPKQSKAFQDDVLSLVSSYEDLYLSRTSLDGQAQLRDAITLHVLNHIMRKRRRVLKNNDRLNHASKDPSATSPADVQDQGFTRPSVLILLPFRSSALRWLTSLISHTPSPEYQIENHSRFLSEYGLPAGATDKLESAPVGTYPVDHVEMFKGNVDDSFRVGIKMTRKSIKLFADFYQCDVVIASPLGLRMSIEKEKNADFLSSIEVLIVDQLDALTMQNWEHVQYVFSNLNKIPKETRDADFSRIKPWYLDGHAAYLRQSIMLSAYDTPEIRSLFNTTIKNVAGKKRTGTRWSPIQVPEGISQSFVQFECPSLTVEAEKRFEHFTTKMLPAVMKSAVQSTNTVIFVPSSFDFVRVHNYLRTLLGTSVAVLSEYSSNQDISRARQAFFSGKKAYLLITERFHFFRRYKIRGIRNVLFYGPPDHAQFYSEFLSYPFLDEGVDASDITCRVLFSRFDWMRLERIAGTDIAADLLKG